ncbi:Tyrosine recombinase XerD [Paludisphaera borealis]|uniref:Tyrosine recombinase XerD n=1 Tax=Paludisphaera borealis TaxID=1387353 RepID=A0A1U7CNL0_9BACT|nr:Tyrosine recombinase XerD [Paludisphaera borealis]
MASLFKPTYSARDPKTGDRIQRKAKKWYGQYIDGDGILRRAPLATDKAAAQALLAELVKRSEQRRAGLSDPFEEHRTRPLTEHLKDFEASLRHGGATEQHTKLVSSRVHKVIQQCGFVFIPDISASRVSAHIAELRRGGLSAQTCNFYLQAAKQFVRWLVRDRRTNDNPLDHLKGTNVKLDRRHDRRALSDAEFSALIKAARNGGTYRGLSGPDRAMLYLVSAGTGLRASELASMTPANFHLGEESSWTVEAAYTKNRETAVRPLHPDLVGPLREWFHGKDSRTRLWPGKWAEHKQAGAMMKRDLTAASITYRNEKKLVADFHSLRHTFITNLHRLGLSPKNIQFLARHSTITLTMDRYTHVDQNDVAAALAGVSLLVPGKPVVEPSIDLQAVLSESGAGSTSCTGACTELAQTPVATRPEASEIGNPALKIGEKTPRHKAKKDKGFDSPCPSVASDVSGGGGIRTHGTAERYTGFRDRFRTRERRGPAAS